MRGSLIRVYMILKIDWNSFIVLIVVCRIMFSFLRIYMLMFLGIVMFFIFLFF